MRIFANRNIINIKRMNYKDYEEMPSWNGSMERMQQLERSAAMPKLLTKVYTWMTLALVITGLTALIVSRNPSLLALLYGNTWVMIGLVVAELAIVIGVSAAISRLSLATATLLFILYSVITGAMFSSIFIIYTGASVAKVFFITAGTFGVMAFIGTTTKKDLSSIGRIAFMALIGLIIATLVNLFVKSSMFDLILSYIGVVIFVALTAYDTQKIKEMLALQTDLGEGAQKVALLGALTLYLDFINLFIHLLRILGDQRS